MTQPKANRITVAGKIHAYVELMRPANIITAFADILAGYAAAGGILFIQGLSLHITPLGLGWLLLSTFGLYGGGVVLNDVFDASLDAEERPERAIPSGRISKVGAAIFGGLLLLWGVFAAFQVTLWSGLLAFFIVLSVIIYDVWAKHHTIMGPFFMGLCRGGNLLLGCSILPGTIPGLWYLALIPIIYIASITLISQGEVHGGKSTSGFFALGLILLVITSFVLLHFISGYNFNTASIFIVLFSCVVLPPFYQAARNPSPVVIKKAVKRGVISQIILDSIIVAGFSGMVFGIFTLLLMLISLLIAKLFSVT